jgi:hypothetical protein
LRYAVPASLAGRVVLLRQPQELLQIL